MLQRLYLDIETTGRPDIDRLLPDPGDAPANYRDPEKIARYKDEQRELAKTRAGLDLDLCEVVAIGWALNDEPAEAITRNTLAERLMLRSVAELVTQADRIIGFAITGFDLRVLRRRALLLDVAFPQLDLGKYRYDHKILDLQAQLSYGDGPQKGKSLQWYCTLFGITDGCEDLSSGADIAALVAAENWPAVATHVRCDVERTRGLARRTGLVVSRAQPVGA